MQQPLTVAINAQINPHSPGGTESALLFLIKKLGEVYTEEKFALLGIKKHAEKLLPFMGPNQTITTWPFPEVGYTRPTALSGKWGNLPRAARRLTPVIDALYRRYQESQTTLRNWRSLRARDSALREASAHVVHFPYPLAFQTNLPFVYEPWDLQHCHYPEFFLPDEWQWRDRMYRNNCARAKLVIVATQWVKQDIVKLYHIAPEKIAVIPRGSLMLSRPYFSESTKELLVQQNIPEEFIFYPAMTFPHKNHLRLLQALARLRDEQRIVLQLICTGHIFKSHWPVIAAELERLQLHDQVRFLGPVSDELLCALFRTAKFMIFPSLFEGLGLPVLEAMALGLPVVASRATCLPEVTRGAALLFDGEKVEELVQALATAARRPEVFAPLREKGRALLSQFSEKKTISTFIACYRFAAGRQLSAEQEALFREATGVGV